MTLFNSQHRIGDSRSAGIPGEDEVTVAGVIISA